MWLLLPRKDMNLFLSLTRLWIGLANLRLLKSRPFISLEPFGRSGLLRRWGNGKGHGNQSGLELWACGVRQNDLHASPPWLFPCASCTTRSTKLRTGVKSKFLCSYPCISIATTKVPSGRNIEFMSYSESLSGRSILIRLFFSLSPPSCTDATVTDGLIPPVFGGGWWWASSGRDRGKEQVRYSPKKLRLIKPWKASEKMILEYLLLLPWLAPAAVYALNRICHMDWREAFGYRHRVESCMTLKWASTYLTCPDGRSIRQDDAFDTWVAVACQTCSSCWGKHV